MSFTNSISQGDFIARAKQRWTDAGFDSLEKLRAIHSYGEPVKGQFDQHVVVAHVDGKHTIVYEDNPSKWYPGYRIYVYYNQLLQLDTDVKVGAVGSRGQLGKYLQSVPDTYDVLFEKATTSVDEEYSMAMGATEYYSASVKSTAGPHQLFANVRKEWHMEAKKAGADKWETGTKNEYKGLCAETSVKLGLPADDGVPLFENWKVLTKLQTEQAAWLKEAEQQLFQGDSK